MKLLVLSDSHGELHGMRLAYRREQPDYVLHLGDYFADGQALQEEFPEMRLVQVAGNCDAYCFSPKAAATRILPFGGLTVYMTHGHRQHVKLGLMNLDYAAREARADLALFGHTHEPYCEKIDGLWLLNPGTCQNSRGSYGVVTIENKIPDCKIVWFQDMETEDGL